MSGHPSFKTRARVLHQLGEQLIKSEGIALLELIKNSYDADASECDVTMYDPSSVKNGKIVIVDDGEGMSKQILSKVWLEVGTSFKDDLKKDKKTYRTNNFKRLRLGEKGIGRLGVHRLGRQIEIITKKEGYEASRLFIDWDKIEQVTYLEDVPVVIEDADASKYKFKKGHGTKIIIEKLRVPWTRKMARDCARSITSLNSPFEVKDNFRVGFEIKGQNWLDGLLIFKDIEQYKLFSFNLTIENDKISDFDYKFVPWETMPKLKPRHLTMADKEISKLARMVYKDGREYKPIDLSQYSIGKVRFEGIIFDRDTRTLDLGVQDKLGLKKYLDTNGGIRVFRDNMRVMDYGEPGNDWLDLGGRRINLPTKRISNNIILGAVYLDREKSTDLQEKANREGFVENEAYDELIKAIRFAIDRIESQRKADKDLLRKHYGPEVTKEPVIASISELKEVVEQNVKDQTVAQQINKYLDRIELEYDTITNSLIKSAGAGLNLIIVIHQIQKIIKEVKEMLKKKAPITVLEERVKSLSKLVEGYTILIRNSEKKLRNLKGIIEQCVFNIEFRLDAHQVKLLRGYEKKIANLEGICSEDHVLNALMNLFDNSIWWLGYSKVKSPEIFLDISDKVAGYTTIVVADNGPGFTKSTEELVKPFISDKPGGMGIGLHLTDQIMQSLGGKLLFPDAEDFTLPERFEGGAIIALAFKKGER